MRKISVLAGVFVLLVCAVSVYSSVETAVPVDGSIDGAGVGDIPVQGETFSFQAEVSRLMDIIINSLYSNKDIFLRELISNASDALDKLRFLALTNKELLGEGEDAKLGIIISADKEKRTLTILDKGIGMSKEELVSNLGTIARSGTTKFLEAIQAGSDSLSLIGQFGVGFYSAYLVADKVIVASKKSDEDKQFVWESDAQETFKVYEDPRGNTVGLHGTEITLLLKEDADEYLDQENLEKIIARYSEFINFPILLRKEKIVKEEVPVEDDEDTVTDLDSEEKEVVEEDGSAAPKTKTVSKTVVEFKQINEYIPIWTRSKDSISEQEYQSFFKLLTKETTDPLTWTHFKAEGGVDFTALLYIPSSSPSELYEKYYQKSASLRLYVRKVLIADQFEELMPRYMNFVRGVVDSDDLPINVSRETLQKDKILQVIGKRLVRNVLKTLETMAKKEEVAKKEESDVEVEEEDDNSKDGNDKATYEQFWKEFGRSIKLGVLEDTKNKNKLLNLLRFPSSKSGEGLTSLQGYVSRMKENQTDIYYIGGENIETVSNSPMLERLKKLDYEVLYFVDPLDEYLTQGFTGFDGYPLSSVSSEGLKLGDEEEEDLKSLEEEFKPLCEWLEEVLGPRVEKVIVSSRVSQAPAVVVTSQYGFSANMERILKAQPIGDKDRVKFLTTRKTFEINPKNPVIKKMKEVISVNPRDPKVYDTAFLVFDSALISSGFAHEDPVNLVARIQRSVNSQLGLDVAFPEVPEDLGKEDVEVPDADDEEIDLSAKDAHVHDEL